MAPLLGYFDHSRGSIKHPYKDMTCVTGPTLQSFPDTTVYDSSHQLLDHSLASHSLSQLGHTAILVLTRLNRLNLTSVHTGCCRLGSWVDEMDGRWVDLIGKDETGWEDGEDGRLDSPFYPN
ncbi:hypothetical protein F2Q70_00026883 [Brassica cretica]|uniref:Uncharacterized protein n=1 Tax=Brassica cretica TaxID=69181 RepID=A0A8S9L5E8_BRACR|nr:hypothetical protein F2Q70_00026883 [Brassica cretica]